MATDKDKKTQEFPICLVIMPFSDPKGYEQGHFRKIYDQILAPAIEQAGYAPHRIDENSESTMIHGKLLDQLINAPMVLCDISSKNPNVLYELGIRHAFDKPVVLVQEKGQDRIFDIAGLTTTEYRKERLYDEVIADQQVIADAIRQTASAEKYSIMSLVKLFPAEPNHDKKLSNEDRIELLLADITQKLNRLEERSQKETVSVGSSWQKSSNTSNISAREYAEMNLLDSLMEAKALTTNRFRRNLSPVLDDVVNARIKQLENAIIDCQHARCQNFELIESAKEMLIKLRGMTKKSKEEVVV